MMTTFIRQPVVSDQTLVKLNYQQTVFIDVVNQVFGIIHFRGNSIFDPLFAIGGTQPMGHDQWATLYRRYQVLGSSIACRMSSAEAAKTTMEICLRPATLETAAYSEIRQMMEQTGSSSKLVPARSTSLLRFKRYASSAKMFAVPGSLASDDSTIANFGANPAKEWLWSIGANTVVPDSDVTRIVCQIKLTYYVKLLDRISLARS